MSIEREKMTEENKPKTTKEEQKKTETTTEILCPKAGTATSSLNYECLIPNSLIFLLLLKRVLRRLENWQENQTHGHELE